MISIIVAVAENSVIGRDNQLIWHLPADLRRFKLLTENHSVIMGKNTYLSLPEQFRPLKNRRNVIVSSSMKKADGVEVVGSVEEALRLCQGEEEVFIIGGASIYRQTIDTADRIYLTVVCKAFDGDVVFPAIDRRMWHTTEKSELLTDEKMGLRFFYETLDRKK